MCSNNTLKYVLKISQLFIDINIEMLQLFNHNNTKILRYVSFAQQDGKEENDNIEKELVSSITDKMNKIFHLTIGLILSSVGDDSDAFNEASESLARLTRTIEEIKNIKKIPMDKNLQELVDRVIDMLIQRSNKHYELISHIILCKEKLYL